MVERLSSILRCPDCGTVLRGPRCPGCGAEYDTRAQPPDLRPSHPLDRTLQIEVGGRSERPAYRLGPLVEGAWPPLPVPDYENLRYGNRLTSVLTSHLPQAEPGDLLLDLGCGDTALGRYLARQRGFGYVGVDNDGSDATVLADVHALPFVSSAFAAACTFAVLEHVRVPRLVLTELARVLRPGGVVLGSVAFLEPYHLRSRFHLTELGLADALESAGFVEIAIEANADWSGVDAILDMHSAAVYPGGLRTAHILRPLLRALTLTGSRGRRAERVTAGYRFVARRPGRDAEVGL
jgi:SAM-dependent methyltransferase